MVSWANNSTSLISDEPSPSLSIAAIASTPNSDLQFVYNTTSDFSVCTTVSLLCAVFVEISSQRLVTTNGMLLPWWLDSTIWAKNDYCRFVYLNFFMMLPGITACVKQHKWDLAKMLLFIASMAHYWLLENCWGNLKFILQWFFPGSWSQYYCRNFFSWLFASVPYFPVFLLLWNTCLTSVIYDYQYRKTASTHFFFLVAQYTALRTLILLHENVAGILGNLWCLGTEKWLI